MPIRSISRTDSTSYGHLSEGIRDVWSELGFDSQSGTISAAELADGLAMLGLPESDRIVSEIFADADINSDGVLEYAELLAYVRRREEEIESAFRRLSQKNSCRPVPIDEIAFLDLKDSLSTLGVNPTDRQVASFLTQHDRKEPMHGTISLQEFASFVYGLPKVDVAAAFESWLAARGGGLDTGAEPGQVDASALPSAMASQEAIFMAGAVAGVISRTATAPLDRLKMLMQVGTKWAPVRPAGVLDGLRAIYAQGGYRSFFQVRKLTGPLVFAKCMPVRTIDEMQLTAKSVLPMRQGNTANVVKVMPESGMKFWAYDTAKHIFCVDPRNPRILERLVAGAFAGAASCIAIYPLEVAKTRLAVASPGTYRGVVHCIQRTARAEGVGALYKGVLMHVLLA